MSFQNRLEHALRVASPMRYGQVIGVTGLQLEVAGIEAAIGEAVTVDTPHGPLSAEVIALREGTLICMPLGEMRGVRSGARAAADDEAPTIVVGEHLLGRVLNGTGQPIDGLGRIDGDHVTIHGAPPHPLRRAHVDRAMPLGIRAIDTAIPCGRGQRMGIFAGSGVGKSSVLSMIARGTEAQVSVLALIGERGREVRDFIEHDLGPDGLARSVVIVATSDEPALVRLRAAFVATRIAEWFRDRDADVVLMMDSLTRFAMAQREVGLAAGEPPATRGYPPSVFSLLPKLLERAGAGERGSITGLYTVLVEGDDMNEPVGDHARSILDGHIVLSRKLATAGHYPSIDILESVSRVAPTITTAQQRQASGELRRLLAAYRDAKDLIEIGAYVPGANTGVDRAVLLKDRIDGYLRQDMSEISIASESWAQLFDVLGLSTPALPVGVG